MSVEFKIDNNIGIIEFDQKDSKVNLLTSDTLRRFDQILDEVGSSGLKLSALVLISRKPDVFIAGADIKEIEQITEPKDGQAKSKAGQEALNKLEDIGIPTVAVIDGVALGGGCELVLACDYRVSTFNEKVKIGLPEVGLGFIPGFGGTYRLPRIVGLEQAMRMILTYKPVDSKKALKIGLVDRLYPHNGLMDQVRHFVDEIISGKIHGNKYERRKQKLGLLAILEDSLIVQFIILYRSRKSVMKLTKGQYPAPLRAIDVVAVTFYENRDKGLALESKEFGDLAVTEISKNLVKVFYLSEKFRKLTIEGAESIVPDNIEKSGVCGAGIMGGGIAQLLSYKGIRVRLKDINYEAVAQGFKAAGDLFMQSVKRRRLSEAECHQCMARITGTLDYSGFADTDLVIEAVVENMEIKKQVFRELSESTSPKTILATNTSALSVTELSKVTKDPSRVIGFHFFNPVHRMPLVEVITTPKTSKKTIVSTLQFAKKLGKTPVLVKDSCGFIVNRILLGYINEAGRILEECGQMEKIDKLMTGFGMPVGPFSLSDEVGLDVGVKVMHILDEGLGERFKPVGIFENIFSKGLLGKKTQIGFYNYSHKTKPNKDIKILLQKKHFEPFSGKDYLKRLVYIMVNEAARCLDDEIVDGPDDIDVGMIFGTGFPPFRGGLLRYADHVGIDRVAGDLEWYASELKADRFRPCDYLKELRDQKRGFYND